MAQHAARTSGTVSKRAVAQPSRRRRASNGRARTRRSPSRSNLGQLERLIRDLELRVAQLTDRDGIRSTVRQASGQVGSAVTSATTQMGDMVADTLSDMAAKVRGGASSVTGIARAGTGALQRVGEEVERRPLITVAIALGIGFLAGMAGRRDEFAGGRRK